MQLKISSGKAMGGERFRTKFYITFKEHSYLNISRPREKKILPNSFNEARKRNLVRIIHQLTKS